MSGEVIQFIHDGGLVSAPEKNQPKWQMARVLVEAVMVALLRAGKAELPDDKLIAAEKDEEKAGPKD